MNIAGALKDFFSGESGRRKKRRMEMARAEEVDDIKLAKNPYLSEAEYQRLAASPYPFVRIVLAYNRSISSGTIELLLKDPNPRVCSAIKSRVVPAEILLKRFGQEGIHPSSFFLLIFKFNAILFINNPVYREKELKDCSIYAERTSTMPYWRA